MTYGKYTIEAKRDFGNQPHWIRGFPVSSGYVVVLDGCNPMPGAAWFQSVAEAILACEILDAVEDASEFWTRWDEIKKASLRIASRKKR